MANDVFLTRRTLVLAKIESTYGVDAAPSHTTSYNAIRLQSPPNIDLKEDLIETVGGNLSRGRGRPIPAIKRSGVTFRTYVQGIDTTSYSASVKPPLGDLFRACGMYETFSASNSVLSTPHYEYAPSADVGSDASVTLYVNLDGKEHRMVGCRGNVNLIWAADAPVIAEFNMRGILSAENETTRAAPTGLPTATPPQWIGSGTIIVGSYSPNVNNFNFNTNNQIYEEPASVAGSASGIVCVLITERNPGGSLDPEVMLAGSYDVFGSWRATSGAVVQLNAGLTQGNKITLTMSNFVLKTTDYKDQSGLSLYSLGYEAYERNTDDNFILIMS